MFAGGGKILQNGNYVSEIKGVRFCGYFCGKQHPTSNFGDKSQPKNNYFYNSTCLTFSGPIMEILALDNTIRW